MNPSTSTGAITPSKLQYQRMSRRRSSRSGSLAATRERAATGSAGASGPAAAAPPTGSSLAALLTFLHRHLDLPLDFFTREQGGPVGHDLLRFRATAGEAGDARRAGGDQGSDLLAEALDLFGLAGAHAQPQHDLGEVAGSRQDAGQAGAGPDQLFHAVPGREGHAGALQ